VAGAAVAVSAEDRDAVDLVVAAVAIRPAGKEAVVAGAAVGHEPAEDLELRPPTYGTFTTVSQFTAVSLPEPPSQYEPRNPWITSFPEPPYPL
jgi:hypothetical protein